MMTKTTSKKRAWCSNIALIPVFIAAICVFSTKSVALDMNLLPEQTNVSTELSTQDNNQMVSNDLIREYNQIVEKFVIEKDGGRSISLRCLSKEDLDRMKEIFLSMSPEQQASMDIIFMRMSFGEKIPTKEQYESWKDPAEYGIWLDGKRIENSELSRYQPSNFGYYSVSRLARNATNYGKHVYQLDIYTTAYCKELNETQTLYLMPNVKKPE